MNFNFFERKGIKRIFENIFFYQEKPISRTKTIGVDILQIEPKSAQGGMNSAQAKFPEIPKLSGFSP